MLIFTKFFEINYVTTNSPPPLLSTAIHNVQALRHKMLPARAKGFVDGPRRTYNPLCRHQSGHQRGRGRGDHVGDRDGPVPVGHLWGQCSQSAMVETAGRNTMLRRAKRKKGGGRETGRYTGNMKGV